MARKRHPNLKLSSLRVDGVKGCAKCIIQDALMENQEDGGWGELPLSPLNPVNLSLLSREVL